ncbi:unnamed protein product, partial [marine sediment metagenome]
RSIESYLIQEQKDALLYSFHGTMNLCGGIFQSKIK